MIKTPMAQRNYSDRLCACAECKTRPEGPRVFKPVCPIQKYANECLTLKLQKKRAYDTKWAARKAAAKAAKKTIPTASGRTAVKRCALCADCPWRRPLDGCQLHNGGCGRPYQEEVIRP